MPATHHRDFLHQLRVLLVFNILEVNILICTLMRGQRRTHLNPEPSPALQPTSQPHPSKTPYTLTSQDTRILSDFFESIKECIHHRIKNSVTNFRKPLEVGLESGNNTETPGHWRDLHLLAVSLVGWPNHNMQFRPPDLPSHPC